MVAITHVEAVIPAKSRAASTKKKESNIRKSRLLRTEKPNPAINNCLRKENRMSDKRPSGNRRRICVTP